VPKLRRKASKQAILLDLSHGATNPAEELERSPALGALSAHGIRADGPVPLGTAFR